MIQLLAAIVGTIAFSILYGVPRVYRVMCGLIGGIGWMVYLMSVRLFDEGISVLFATMVVVLMSRIAAVIRKCPATLFMIPGIFPLVPGAKAYWATYYVVMDQGWKAAEAGYEAVKIAVCIVLGMVFIFEIPQKMFVGIFGKK